MLMYRLVRSAHHQLDSAKCDPRFLCTSFLLVMLLLTSGGRGSLLTVQRDGVLSMDSA